MASTDPKATGRKHTVSDHLFGTDANHVHDADSDHDHDHDHFEMEGLRDADALELTSIGIDVGSSTTQVAFSRLALDRIGGSRFVANTRQTLYQSPVALTPYASDGRIDEARLSHIVDEAFAAAGLHPDSIDCGVVILTGAAAQRENGEAITSRLAERCGDLVSAAAGHHMEARLAAHGSGAVRLSHERHARLLNLDLGGATTKLALIDDGEVIATAALAIGGRLCVFDDEGRIVRLEAAGQRLADRAGARWRIGDVATPGEMEAIAEVMANDLIAAIAGAPSPDLWLTDPIKGLDRIDGIIASGGVAEYIYDRETREFGDLGLRLGRALRRRLAAGALPWPLLAPAECIRATALGASEHSVQVSGQTSYIPNPATVLPRRNLQVLEPPFEFGEAIDADALAAAIRSHLRAFDVSEAKSDVALAFRWQGLPDYERLRAFADGIARGLEARIGTGLPLYLMVEGDIARSLGAMLRDELGIENDIIVLDGISLADFDYVDLGRLRLPSETVPVTIKSLVFRGEHRHGHGHGHDHDRHVAREK